MEAVAYPQSTVFEAAIQWARTQGTVPAPETAHAIRAVIDEALAAEEAGEERVILFSYSGHGFLDLAAYDDYLHGRLMTPDPPPPPFWSSPGSAGHRSRDQNRVCPSNDHGV